MRSHVIKSVSESIIAYKQGENMNVLRKIASAQGIKLTAAEDNAAGETVGFLAGYTGFASNGSKEEAEDGCIVFAGLSSRQIDGVLSGLKKNGTVIPYKAVITASNQSWSLKKLIEELKKEHKKIGQ